MQYKALKIACAVALLSVVARESLSESVGDERAVSDEKAISDPGIEEKVEQPAELENKAATASIDHRESSGAVDRTPIKPGQKLTTRQKRLFVLGLGASEKN